MLRQTIFSLILVALLAATVQAQRQPYTAMLVVRSADLTNGFDQAINDRLVSLGYTVTIVEGGAFVQATADSLVDFALCVVSESISSTNVDEIAGADVPLLHNEPYGWDNVGYAGPDSSGGTWFPASSNSMTIIDDSHPVMVAAGASNGAFALYNQLTGFANLERTMIGKEAADFGAGVDILATGSGTEAAFAVVWAAEQGAALTVGTAANRIFSMCLPGDEAGPNIPAADVRDEYWAIFDAGVQWLDQLSAPPSIGFAFSDVLADDDWEVWNDTDSDRADPLTVRDQNINGGTSIGARWLLPDVRMRVGYIRFDLNDINPSYISGTFTTVTLSLSGRNNDGDGNYLVHGVLEAFDDVIPDEVTYNNAPGIDQAASPNVGDLPVLQTDELATSLTLYGPLDSGDVQVNGNQALLDFINADEDGIVLFMVTPANTQPTEGDNGGLLASLERESALPGSAPRLNGVVEVETINRATSWTMFE